MLIAISTNALQTNFYHCSKHYDSVHIVCNIVYQSTSADEKAGNICREWSEKGFEVQSEQEI